MRPTPDSDLCGIFAAAVTPLTPDLAPDLDALLQLLDFFARRGCHGALLLGTTGEGPAFSLDERVAILRAGLQHRAAALPGFKLLAGTGCANLPDTITLTRAAFDLGADAALALPPFYFKGVSPAGLVDYFDRLVRAAVPAGGRLLVYHIPQVSGVAIPAAALVELRQRFPGQLFGMKDSQDEWAHSLSILQQFPGFGLFLGSDSLLADGFAAGAVGAITALANVTSPLDRAVWDAHLANGAAQSAGAAAQERLLRARQAVTGLPGPAALKSALADLFGFPFWPVRPPLQPLTPDQRTRLASALSALVEGY
jgi:4-hydroxy-tetrahydrodipicolinate synthase